MFANPDSDQICVAHREDMGLTLAALRPHLRLFARRHCKTSTDIDDLVQETLLTALCFRDRYTLGKPVKPWLRTIMRNLFITQARQRKAEQMGLEGSFPLVADSLPSQEWVVSQHEVVKAVDRLKPKWRQALIEMSGGATYEDAAEAIGCDVGTLKTRVRRARQALTTNVGDIFT